MILFISTVAIGMCIFQALIALEAFWKMRQEYNNFYRINWFPPHKTPQAYQRRKKGVQTLMP